MTIQQTLNLAMQRLGAGQLAEAEALYRQVLQAQPTHPDALHLLGIIAFQTKRNDMALELIQKAIAVNSRSGDYYCNLGLVLAALGKLADAVAAYQASLVLNPLAYEAFYNMGNALRDLGKPADAVAAYQRGLSLQPRQPAALANMGSVLRTMGRLPESIAAYREALALRPGDFAALLNLGNALVESGRMEEAIVAYQQAQKQNPQDARVLERLGLALRDNGRFDEALDCFSRLVSVRPDSAEAWFTLGNILFFQGKVDEAIAAYDKSVALQPDNANLASRRLVALVYSPKYDSKRLLAEDVAWAKCHGQIPRLNLGSASADRDPERRLRIGYVSPDFREHVVGWHLIPLLSRHDHTQFEIYCYANVTRPDAMTRQVASYSDAWRDISPLTDDDAAELIQSDQIDILVDLSVHGSGNRLSVFARRPSPVQVTFAGYPGGTGLAAIDWRLTDPYLDPPGETDDDYVERSWRLPDSFWCFNPVAGGVDDATELDVGPLPALSSGIVTFGCLNQLSRISTPTIQLWAKALAAVANSRLILLAPQGSARDYILRRCAENGIDANCVSFVDHAPRRAYLAYYRQIDLGLDTLPYNGHTTSLDAFWMGVPVVTRVGNTVVGRAGLSQLSNLKLTELAAWTDEQFVQIVADLASDLMRLAELRRTLRQRMIDSPLMDG
jgi:predicted O-linked N-acetylglucosamine transferase (SPINDLY family)